MSGNIFFVINLKWRIENENPTNELVFENIKIVFFRYKKTEIMTNIGLGRVKSYYLLPK